MLYRLSQDVRFEKYICPCSAFDEDAIFQIDAQRLHGVILAKCSLSQEFTSTMLCSQTRFSLHWIPLISLSVSTIAKDDVGTDFTVSVTRAWLKRATLNEMNPDILPLASDEILSSRTVQWRSSYQRGVYLWQTLQDALTHLPNEECPNLRENWFVERPEAPSFTDTFREDCNKNGILNLLDEEYRLHASPLFCSNVYDHICQSTREGLPGKTNRYFDFSNWYSTTLGAIVAAYNEARIDPLEFSNAGPDQQLHQDPRNWYRAPYYWAQVAFATWNYLCSIKGQSLTALRFIVRSTVDSKATVATIEDIFRNGPVGGRFLEETNDQRKKYRFSHDYTNKDVEFYALMGTPNGVGAPRLLSTFANAFATRGNSVDSGQITKVKTIGKIKFQCVFVDEKDMDCSIAFILDDVDPPPGFDAPPTPAIRATDQGLPSPEPRAYRGGL